MKMIDRGTQTGARFHHEASLYEGLEGFVRSMEPFVRDAVEASEPILVAVHRERLKVLRDALADVATHVRFLDMTEVGRNPTRIISIWQRFASDATKAGRVFRGIGEPIWAERSADELVECVRHEMLINVAFADANGSILCPYDVTALSPDVIEQAHLTHPIVEQGGQRTTSASYDPSGASRPFDAPLPQPDGDLLLDTRIDQARLDVLRQQVLQRARAAQLDPDRASDLVLAVNEVATNTLRHSGGAGTLRMWRTVDAVVCEVRDGGAISDPLAGRTPPFEAGESGIGLWLVNELCDLVQIRTFPDGSVVRLHVRL